MTEPIDNTAEKKQRPTIHIHITSPTTSQDFVLDMEATKQMYFSQDAIDSVVELVRTHLIDCMKSFHPPPHHSSKGERMSTTNFLFVSTKGE